MVERAHPLAAVAATAPDCAAVRLATLPPCARFVIRGDAALLGLAVPAVNRVLMDGERALVWLGPDELVLIAPDGASPPLSPGGGAAIVDVSHRDTALSVAGPLAGWAINAFCPLDLHPSAFPVGMCTRTVFGKAGVLLWRTEAEAFRIEAARSLAPYVWACLEEARRELLARDCLTAPAMTV